MKQMFFLVLLGLNLTSLAFQNVGAQQSSPKAIGFAHAEVQPVDFAACRWTDGFWLDRLKTVQQSSVPAMWETMSNDRHTQFLSNFRIAAGQIPGKHRGPSWNDGDFYKWIEAASVVFAQTRDATIEGQIEEGVLAIKSAQRPDGYIHTPIQIRKRQGDASAIPFSEPLQFELYNFGHLMTAGCAHFRSTNRRDLLDCAIMAADFLERSAISPENPLGRTAICPSHYMALIELGRLLNEPRYVRLAADLIDRRDRVEDGTDDNQDRIPLRQQKQVVGHAVRANYLYAGAADLLLETGDRELRQTLQLLWDDVVSTKLYITGACGALFDGASPDGTAAQKTISRTHQAYGRAYQLPNSTAHNESCASVGNILWNWRMLLATGECKYADVMERSLYNGLLASVSLDGNKYFYTNTLRQLDSMPVPLRWSRERQSFISCYCCPPNIIRTIARAHELAYGRSQDSIWVHLYGSNRLETTLLNSSVIVEQTSEYPWSGDVQIRIQQSPSDPWALKLRIPGWTQSARVSINGVHIQDTPKPGSYAILKRQWQKGDTIRLTLPMPVEKIESHPLVEETRNHAAVQRGPIVYCLESKDLPDGFSLMDMSMKADEEWKAVVDTQLSGSIALQARLMQRESRHWTGQLYRPMQSNENRLIEARLVPYFAWGNRGSSEMSVWLPLSK